MTNGPDNSRLDRIEEILLNLAARQDQMQVQQASSEQKLDTLIGYLDADRIQRQVRDAQIDSQFEEIGSMLASLTRRQEESIEQAERDRAEIQRIWQYLSQGRNGHSGN